MSFEKMTTNVSAFDADHQLLAAKEFMINFKKIDNCLEKLNNKVHFTSIFQKKNKVIQSFDFDGHDILETPIKDKNNDQYKIFKLSINEYKEESNDKLLKKVYQITVANKDTPITIIDNKAYVTAGVVITVAIFYEEEGYIIAQSNFLQSFLNTTMGEVPYTKGPSALGELSLINTNFKIDTRWNILWISNNIFVKASSKDIPQEKVIEILEWLAEYIN